MRANIGKRWTEQDDQELRVRIKRNESQGKIAEAMGRTFTAVGSRAQHLGLRMPAPLRPRHSD
jgi:hypothetical protein